MIHSIGLYYYTTKLIKYRYYIYDLRNSSIDGCLYANMIGMKPSEKATVRLPLNLKSGPEHVYISFYFNISTEFGKLEVSSYLHT